MTGNRFRPLFPLLVPSWILKQIERSKLPNSALLNLDKMLQVCSLEDLAILYCLNAEPAYADRIFGVGAAMPSRLAEYWAHRFGTPLQRVLDVVGLYRGVLEERLFFEAEPQSSEPRSKPMLLTVESDDLRVTAVAIVLKPGQFGGADQREVQQYIVREYMRQLYVFTDYATLAADPLFGRYLKSVVTLDNVSEPA